MSRAQDDPPPNWSGMTLFDAGHGVYVHVGDIALNGNGSNVWVYHWHTPDGLPPRWQLTACSAHTVQSVHPLTLSPSLGCEDGCPNHGWLTAGRWNPVNGSNLLTGE